MQSGWIKIERDRVPEVAILRIMREEKRNALNDQLLIELTTAIELLRDDTSVKAIVLTGGLRVFSAGADVSVLSAESTAMDLNRARREMQRGGRLCAALEGLPQVTIAAIEGAAVGGGFSLALACDWRVMAESAWCYVPEVRLGVNFGWGTLPRLISLVGPARAKKISILCRRHSASELREWGVADEVTAPGDALATALQLAREAAAMPAMATQSIKQAINAHSHALLALSSNAEMDQMLLCLTDPEGQEARMQTLREIKR